MDLLDHLVIDHLKRRLLVPERIRELLAALLAKQARMTEEVDGRVASLTDEIAGSKQRLSRLYRMVEEGVAELDDLLRERIADLKSTIVRSEAALDRIRHVSRDLPTVDTEAIQKFTERMAQALTEGDMPFRRAYLRSLVDAVIVKGTEIRIIGTKSTLEGAITGQGNGSPWVRSSVRGWRG